MSTSFFITPFDPKAWEDPNDTSEKPTSDLQIDRDLFRSKLLEHWTDSRFRESGSWSWFLHNEKDIIGGDLWLHLQQNGQIVSFNPAPKHVFLEFILWYVHLFRQVTHFTYPTLAHGTDYF
jgi:hypothetical protein